MKSISVPVELTIERKGRYKCYFANLRALQDIVDEFRFEADTMAMAIDNLQYELVGGVNHKVTKFEQYKQVETLGTTVSALEAGAME